MKRFSRVSAFWASFYSHDLYRDVVRNWKGIGVLYLLLLLAICWLPSAAGWYVGLSEFGRREGQTLVQEMPSIQIQGGVMTADPPGRHEILLGSDGNELLVVIDDSIDTIPSDMSEDALVFTRHEAGMIRPSQNERRIWVLTDDMDIEVAPGDVGAFLGTLAFWIPPLGYVGAVAGSLVFRILQALLYGGIAILFARSRRVSLEYAGAVRLAAVAVTPVVIVRTLLWLIPWDPVWWIRWPVAVVVTVAYIGSGVRAIDSPPEGAELSGSAG